MQAESIGVQRFDGLDDPGVEDSPPLGWDVVVGHLVREYVFEGVFDIRAATRLLKELCGLKPSERGAKLVFADAGHSLDDRVRHILAHDRGDLDHLLVLGTEPADPAEEHLVDRVRHRGADC